MPHERSTMVKHWVAARVAERLGKTRMPTHGSFNGDMQYKVEDVDKRIQKAKKRLETVVAAEANQGAGRNDSLNARIDALRRKCSTGYGCGSACISLRKECRTSPSSSIGKQRLKRLMEIAAGGASKQRGIAPVKATEAGAMAAAIATRRSQEAGQLRGSRRQAAAEKAKAAEQASARPLQGEQRIPSSQPSRCALAGGWQAWSMWRSISATTSSDSTKAPDPSSAARWSCHRLSVPGGRRLARRSPLPRMYAS